MNSRNKLRLVGVLVAALVGILAIALPGTASARDRNHDKIPDKWERHHHLSLHKNQARRDQDRDSLKNRKEFKARTNPRDADSDDDGVEDGDENAGTVASFDGTTLTINLFNGTSVSGLVTDETEISCEADDNDGDNGDDDGDNGDDDGGSGDDDGDNGDDDGDNGDVTSQSTAKPHSASSVNDDDPGDDDGDNGDDDQGDDDGDNNDEGECTAADLTPGTVVQEAELELSNGQATFEEVELVK